jgi:hypothetical protein
MDGTQNAVFVCSFNNHWAAHSKTFLILPFDYITSIAISLIRCGQPFKELGKGRQIAPRRFKGYSF